MAKSKLKLILIVIAVIVALVSAVMSSSLNNEAIDESKMFVDFIDVGQGDCTLIRTEDTVILIDGGEAGEADVVINHLKENGVAKIDCCIATHPHSDHIGSLADVLNEFDIDTVIMPEIPEDIIPTTRTYENFLDSVDANARNVYPAVAGETYEYGELKLEILGPTKDYDDLNLMSVVAKVSYGDTSVMLTGDTEIQAENDMLAYEYGYESSVDVFSADILKVAHHGSSTSTSDEWLYLVGPEYAVISCALDNSYGHPHKETIKKLEKNNIEYYRTDLIGTISFESDGNKFTLIENK